MRAMIVVDLQNDFVKGGALALPKADEEYCYKISKKLIPKILTNAVGLTIFSQEWHPENHTTFDTYGGEWPAHCVGLTEGAEIIEPINSVLQQFGENYMLVRKGLSRDNHPYSAFGNDQENTKLNSILHYNNVTMLDVLGLATDYCVKDTVLDGLCNGYHVNLHRGYCRGLTDESEQAAVDEMQAAGALILEGD